MLGDIGRVGSGFLCGDIGETGGCTVTMSAAEGSISKGSSVGGLLCFCVLLSCSCVFTMLAAEGSVSMGSSVLVGFGFLCLCVCLCVLLSCGSWLCFALISADFIRLLRDASILVCGMSREAFRRVLTNSPMISLRSMAVKVKVFGVVAYWAFSEAGFCWLCVCVCVCVFVGRLGKSPILVIAAEGTVVHVV